MFFMAEPVTIVDRNVLKVLSVDTRMDILKELSQGDRMPSQLGKSLRKNSSTIVEHLEAMERAGLVKKIAQPGRKWVFYTLTQRGEGIVQSKSRRLVVILATSFISIAGGFFFLNSYSSLFSAGSDSAARIAEVSQTIAQAAEATAPTAVSVHLYLSIALFAAGGTGLALYFLKRMRA
jgi:DNA-binding transcriptional ArsR family regulator